MDSENQQERETKVFEPRPKADESSGIYVRGFVKISDPDTGEVIVQTAN